MDVAVFLGQASLGITLSLAALGSSLGVGAAGRAAAGAWGKAAKAGKPLNFTYIILVGMPVSQTIYAFVLMFVGLKAGIVGEAAVTATHAGTLFGIGLGAGICEMISAWVQGLIGAAACRALSEGDGKGLINMVIAMGMVETVGLFGLVFMLLMVPTA